MNVKVRMSANITSALVYGRNPDKGGEYILYNCLDPTLSPEEQAEDWKAMSRGYKNKVCQIIISFSDKDTERIRQMRGAARINYERQLLLAFFKNLAERGNDVTKAPFGVFHHGNTDNEHFHVYVLMTDLEGKRWDNSFIGKNATRSAAKVSMDFGLEGCPKAMTRELAHQRHTGKITRTLQDVKQDSRKRKYDRTVDAEGHIHRDRGRSVESSVISERLRRQRSIQEADKRKRMYKYLIEKAAVNADTSEFLVRCKAQGITIFLDPKLGVSMSAVDDGGKERRYSLKSDLGVDANLLAGINTQLLQTGYVRETDRKKAELMAQAAKKKEVTKRSQTVSRVSHIGNSVASGAGKAAGLLNKGGGSSDENRENEVGGSGDSEEDEEWKRRNGYSM